MLENSVFFVMTPGRGTTQGIIALSDEASGFHVYVFSAFAQGQSALVHHLWITGELSEEILGVLTHAEYPSESLPLVHLTGPEGDFLGMALSLCDPAAAAAETQPNLQDNGIALFITPDPNMRYGLVGVKEPDDFHFYIFYSKQQLQDIVRTHAIILPTTNSDALDFSAHTFPVVPNAPERVHLVGAAAVTLIMTVRWVIKSCFEFEAVSANPGRLS